MAVSTLLIQVPLPLTNRDKIEISVSWKTSIHNIIKKVLDEQIPGMSRNANAYSLCITPNNEILLPMLYLEDYKIPLAAQNCSLLLLPKNFGQVTILTLNYQIIEFFDFFQSLDAVINSVGRKLNISYTSDLSAKAVILGSKDYVSDTSQQMGSINMKMKNLPIQISFKREIPRSVFTSSSTIFKGTINDALSRDKFKDSIPFFISKIFEIVLNFKDTVGIYRLSGEFTTMEQIASKINETNDQEVLSNYLSQQKVHDLACVIKLYLRQLKEPLIPTFLDKEFRDILKIQDDAEKIHTLKKFVRYLPASHYNLLFALCKHLEEIAASPSNQMGIKNLAICFGPCILKVSQGASAIAETQSSQNVSQLILENWKYIFINTPLIFDNRKCETTQSIQADNGTVIPANSQVTITGKVENSDNEVYIKFNEITATTLASSLNLKVPPLKIIRKTPASTIILNHSMMKFLKPDDPAAISVPDAKSLITQRVEKLSLIENELNEIMSRISMNPKDIQSLNRFNELKTAFMDIISGHPSKHSIPSQI
ncbi:hypothetical protein TRFO_06943 [Tritrichomonas foetus]|uniref:Rho-GAP domain-containing protein n=1 Tax=Tritrichomonas foetus TaxID=1144522 RepID=A0A1J4JUR9_9EUKA|nr:hypothetical protein TRFO_06943 [Tritrichomonas foetus]|eukprot:OHT02889.1 hypothetical protein TRFO_06943 [Tritrichomonas foetus]